MSQGVGRVPLSATQERSLGDLVLFIRRWLERRVKCTLSVHMDGTGSYNANHVEVRGIHRVGDHPMT